MFSKQSIVLTAAITIFILGIGSSFINASSVHWRPATTNAPWEGRYVHTSVVFDNKMWIMGGLTIDEVLLNDVWYSINGTDWENIGNNAQWSARYGHVSVVFNDKIWVMGGYDNAFKNDVWYSSDGVTWTQATASAGWSPRSLPTAVVFDGKMWIMGGWEGGELPSAYKNDVWYSSNGINWTQTTSSAGWSARTLHASVVFGGKMWVLGGRDGVNEGDRKNDVWFSTDGTTWVEKTSNAGWSKRTHLAAVVFENIMWVIGGYPGYAPESDVWYSSNGKDWTASSWSSAWSVRIGHRVLEFDNKMWIIGGAIEAEFYDDVWFSSPGAVPTVTPAEDPSEIIMPLMGIGFSMMFMGVGYGITRGKNILAAFVFLNIGFLTFWFLGMIPSAMVIIGFVILILYALHEREII